jgi:hypothetical protein
MDNKEPVTDSFLTQKPSANNNQITGIPGTIYQKLQKKFPLNGKAALRIRQSICRADLQYCGNEADQLR